ncbi:helix-turn-helix transcriptional regulator [Paenibacillus sp. 1001270B_150601_E10]|uniref:helix-turn-helix transcriptional regulator n=1 Tax=Paenibacillus sp. 1001270B_150601_E10 TaxID=2787079 RepID=UPI00189D86FA|nr:winged helix-turn-helix transcriptional regulator [Paenibacillus sp. 1001270B_150601_E10]
MTRGQRKPSTRGMLLHLIKTNGSMSAAQLAEQLGMTEMGVRRYLTQYVEEGVLETEQVRQPMGRPLQMYHLSSLGDERFPKQYHQLVLDLLKEVEKLPVPDEDAAAKGSDRIGQLFAGRQETLLDKYMPHMKGKSLDERIQELGNIQDSNGYMVETEQQQDGTWLLHEYNCPIAQVADRYEEPCACELALFQQLLQADVERTECLAKQGRRCTYRIKSQKENES